MALVPRSHLASDLAVRLRCYRYLSGPRKQLDRWYRHDRRCLHVYCIVRGNLGSAGLGRRW